MNPLVSFLDFGQFSQEECQAAAREVNQGRLGLLLGAPASLDGQSDLFTSPGRLLA